MTFDWLPIAIGACIIAAIALAIVAAMFWHSDRADELADYERQMIEFDSHLADLIRGRR